MENTLRQIFSLNIEGLLETKLLPMALAIAGLPAENGLESLLDLKLPHFEASPRTPAHYRHAATLSSDCTLFAVVLLAKELALSEKARQISEEILALIWKDLTDFAWAEARESDYGGMFSEGSAAASNWEKWKQSNRDVQAAWKQVYEETLCDILNV